MGRCGGKRRAQNQLYFTISLPAASCEKVSALNCKMIRFVKLNLRQRGQKAEYFFSMKKRSEKEESARGNFGLLCSSNKKTPPLDTSETKTQCFFFVDQLKVLKFLSPAGKIVSQSLIYLKHEWFYFYLFIHDS